MDKEETNFFTEKRNTSRIPRWERWKRRISNGELPLNEFEQLSSSSSTDYVSERRKSWMERRARRYSAPVKNWSDEDLLRDQDLVLEREHTIIGTNIDENEDDEDENENKGKLGRKSTFVIRKSRRNRCFSCASDYIKSKMEQQQESVFSSPKKVKIKKSSNDLGRYNLSSKRISTPTASTVEKQYLKSVVTNKSVTNTASSKWQTSSGKCNPSESESESGIGSLAVSKQQNIKQRHSFSKNANVSSHDQVDSDHSEPSSTIDISFASTCKYVSSIASSIDDSQFYSAKQEKTRKKSKTSSRSSSAKSKATQADIPSFITTETSDSEMDRSKTYTISTLLQKKHSRTSFKTKRKQSVSISRQKSSEKNSKNLHSNRHSNCIPKSNIPTLSNKLGMNSRRKSINSLLNESDKKKGIKPMRETLLSIPPSIGSLTRSKVSPERILPSFISGDVTVSESNDSSRMNVKRSKEFSSILSGGLERKNSERRIQPLEVKTSTEEEKNKTENVVIDRMMVKCPSFINADNAKPDSRSSSSSKSKRKTKNTNPLNDKKDSTLPSSSKSSEKDHKQSIKRKKSSSTCNRRKSPVKNHSTNTNDTTGIRKPKITRSSNPVPSFINLNEDQLAELKETTVDEISSISNASQELSNSTSSTDQIPDLIPLSPRAFYKPNSTSSATGMHQSDSGDSQRDLPSAKNESDSLSGNETGKSDAANTKSESSSITDKLDNLERIIFNTESKRTSKSPKKIKIPIKDVNKTEDEPAVCQDIEKEDSSDSKVAIESNDKNVPKSKPDIVKNLLLKTSDRIRDKITSKFDQKTLDKNTMSKEQCEEDIKTLGNQNQIGSDDVTTPPTFDEVVNAHRLIEKASEEDILKVMDFYSKNYIRKKTDDSAKNGDKVLSGIDGIKIYCKDTDDDGNTSDDNKMVEVDISNYDNTKTDFKQNKVFSIKMDEFEKLLLELQNYNKNFMNQGTESETSRYARRLEAELIELQNFNYRLLEELHATSGNLRIAKEEKQNLEKKYEALFKALTVFEETLKPILRDYSVSVPSVTKNLRNILSVGINV